MSIFCCRARSVMLSVEECTMPKDIQAHLRNETVAELEPPADNSS
jgi:hypothetical protein